MNHNCHGDVFERHGKTWLRCFLDSTFTAIAADKVAAVETCPACGRPWRGERVTPNFLPAGDPKVALGIDLPFFRQRTANLHLALVEALGALDEDRDAALIARLRDVLWPPVTP